MRHDPASAAVVVMLRGLKMHGMAQAANDLMEQGAPAFETAIPILSQLLKAETAEREVRSVAYQIKAARFPSYKDLTGFDFGSSEINEALVRQLHRGEFMDRADNAVLIGGPGTGKTHVATALAVHAVEHRRKKVRFFSTIDLVNALEQEKAHGKAGQIADRLTRHDLVILDEIFSALAAGLVTEAEIVALADLRPATVHLLLTGCGAPAALVERADLVTEMRNVKHPFDRGVEAQAGIEF